MIPAQSIYDRTRRFAGFVKWPSAGTEASLTQSFVQFFDNMTTTTVPPLSSELPAEEPATSSTSTRTKVPVAPSPPKTPNPEPISENPSVDTQQQDQSNPGTQHSSVPYKIPEWSEPPCHKFYFEVFNDGSIVDQFDV